MPSEPTPRLSHFCWLRLLPSLQGPNPQPLSIPFPQAIQSLEPARLKPPARVTAIAAGGDHSMAVTVAGALLAFGSNKHGQARVLAAPRVVWPAPDALQPNCTVALKPRPHRSLSPASVALLQLGTGDTLDRMIPTEVPLALESEGGQLVRAMQVHCGAQHTLALVQVQGHHQVRSVGGNSYGELGLGDRLERHRFHPIPALKVCLLPCLLPWLCCHYCSVLLASTIFLRLLRPSFAGQEHRVCVGRGLAQRRHLPGRTAVCVGPRRLRVIGLRVAC